MVTEFSWPAYNSFDLNTMEPKNQLTYKMIHN